MNNKFLSAELLAINNSIKAIAVIIAVFCGLQTNAQGYTGYENGHEWVDMGTSVMWATTNVGAASATNYGDFYSWKGGKSDAVKKWGGKWRMPTAEEYRELVSKCKLTWTGNTAKITAKNGNVLYLPAYGYLQNSSLTSGATETSSHGYYWTGDHDSYEDDAICFSLWIDHHGAYTSSKKQWYGMFIRLVMPID